MARCTWPRWRKELPPGKFTMLLRSKGKRPDLLPQSQSQAKCVLFPSTSIKEEREFNVISSIICSPTHIQTNIKSSIVSFLSAAFQREGDWEVPCGSECPVRSSDVILPVLRGAAASSAWPLWAQPGSEARAARAEPHLRCQHHREDGHQLHQSPSSQGKQTPLQHCSR